MDEANKQADSEGTLREHQEELSKLRSLREHGGYVYVMDIAREQLEGRKQAIFLTPLKAMDEVLEQEYKKGEIAGINLFMQIVDIRIGDLEELIKHTSEETENADSRTISNFDGDTISP